MTNKEIERKIAVIFATYVVGYSNLLSLMKIRPLRILGPVKKSLRIFLKNMTAEFLIPPEILC